MTAEHPLAVGMSIWGLVIGLLTIFDIPASRTLTLLPQWEAVIWSVILVVAGVATLAGLYWVRSPTLVSRSLALTAVAIFTYAVAIVSQVGFAQSGAVVAVLIIVSACCFKQSRDLRQIHRSLLVRRQEGA